MTEIAASSPAAAAVTKRAAAAALASLRAAEPVLGDAVLGHRLSAADYAALARLVGAVGRLLACRCSLGV